MCQLPVTDNLYAWKSSENDEQLNWEAHVKAIGRKIGERIGVMKQAKPFVPDTIVTARNQVKATLKNAEKDYYTSEVLKNKNNSGSLWNVINNCIPSKDRNMLTHAKDLSLVAEKFNNYFTSVGSTTALAVEQNAKDYNLQLFDPLKRTMQYPVEEQFHFEHVSTKKVQRIVLEMPLKNHLVLISFRCVHIKIILPSDVGSKFVLGGHMFPGTLFGKTGHTLLN